MAANVDRAAPGPAHPFHAALLSAAAPLFAGALLADCAYHHSYQIQWSNFASWLLVGAMVLLTIALLCEVVALVRGRRAWVRVLVVAAAWVVGFLDALHHGRDAWAIMPAAPWYSLAVSALVLVAAWMAFASLPGARTGGAR